MRCEYTATGHELFGVLRSAAYGLRRPTADTILHDGQLIARPRPKSIPVGTGPDGRGRDERLLEAARQLEAKGGVLRCLGTWELQGHCYFDGNPWQADWLSGCARRHARSWHVRLSIPALEAWLADGGEEKIAYWKERRRRESEPIQLPRNDPRPPEVRTRVKIRPDLAMLTQGQYPQRYCPKTNQEEMRGVLVTECQSARISIGRGFESPRHGHTASLVIDRKHWMNTSPVERLMMGQDARRCTAGSDAFVGGLGLGLIVLYLARRCRCITVAEIDERVVRMVWPRLVAYLRPRYPDLELRIFVADALHVVGREPKRYDFVYMDIWPAATSKEKKVVQMARLCARYAQPQATILCWAEGRILGDG